MKLKKSQRRAITISILIILIIIMLYCFNIFNIKNIINGVSVETKNTETGKLTTMNGKDISLPLEFSSSNISILENDKITEYTKEELKSTGKTVSQIKVKTNKSINEVFTNYSNQFSNPMTFETNSTKTIICGNAENLIRIIVSKDEYIIKIEK